MSSTAGSGTHSPSARGDRGSGGDQQQKRKLREEVQKIKDEAKHRAQELKVRAKEGAKRSRAKASKGAEAFSEALSKNVDRIAERTSRASRKIGKKVVGKRSSSEVVLLHDKFVFTSSVFNLVAIAFIAGAAPQYYYLWHIVMAFSLIARRWVSFRRQKAHYYLYDFCYWANALTVVYTLWRPESITLFHVIFMAANGPMGWSIPTFTNSMVFHSSAHMTSVFIHLSPAVLSYCIRWHAMENAFGHAMRVCDDFPGCWTTSALQVFNDGYFLFYFPWLVLYNLWLYVLLDKRIKERGYETLFEYVIQQKCMAFLPRLTNKVWLQKLIYSGMHAVFALLSMVTSLVFWYSQPLHCLYLAVIICWAAWNASGFYFSVFAKRYVKQLEERALSREESIKLLAAAMEDAPQHRDDESFDDDSHPTSRSITPAEAYVDDDRVTPESAAVSDSGAKSE